jgi:esterase/lipase superfamily enzyme
MERRTTAWFSHNLNIEMPLVAYGHAGYPLLMFPTAAADYLEYERFYLVDAIRPFIEAGQIRAYSINSVNRYSLLNEQMPAHLKAALLTQYDRYITDECGPGRCPPANDRSQPGSIPGGEHLLQASRRFPWHDRDEWQL